MAPSQKKLYKDKSATKLDNEYMLIKISTTQYNIALCSALQWLSSAMFQALNWPFSYTIISLSLNPVRLYPFHLKWDWDSERLNMWAHTVIRTSAGIELPMKWKLPTKFKQHSWEVKPAAEGSDTNLFYFQIKDKVLLKNINF